VLEYPGFVSRKDAKEQGSKDKFVRTPWYPVSHYPSFITHAAGSRPAPSNPMANFHCSSPAHQLPLPFIFNLSI
jgi:hypothetical protein